MAVLKYNIACCYHKLGFLIECIEYLRLAIASLDGTDILSTGLQLDSVETKADSQPDL